MRNTANLSRTFRKIYLILIFIVFAYLLLYNLGHYPLWDDEANTALFAKSILEDGFPYGWDGRNLIAYRNGSELNDVLINTYMPPLQYYIAAVGLAFGNNAFCARLPFAIFALLSLLLLLSVIRLHNANEPISLALFVLSPSVLLFSRQCRYYSLVVFFTLLVYWLFHQWLAKARKSTILYFAFASLLLFISSYLAYAALIAALASEWLWVRQRRPLWQPLCLFLSSALLPVIYWFVVQPYQQNPVAFAARHWTDKLLLFYWHLRELDAFGWVPTILLLVFVILYIRGKRQAFYKIVRYIAFLLVYTAIIALFSPQPVSATTIADMRYLVPLLPFLALLTSEIIRSLFSLSHPIAYLSLFLCLSCNLWQISLWQEGPQAHLYQYIREIHAPRKTPYEEVLQYLAEQPQKQQTIWTLPEHHSYAIMFHQGDDFYIYGQLKDERLAMHQLPAYVYHGKVIPDIVIVYGLPFIERIIDYLQRETKARYRVVKKIPIYLQKPLPVEFIEGTRPELPWHIFVEDGEHRAVVHILRRE